MSLTFLLLTTLPSEDLRILFTFSALVDLVNSNTSKPSNSYSSKSSLAVSEHNVTKMIATFDFQKEEMCLHFRSLYFVSLFGFQDLQTLLIKIYLSTCYMLYKCISLIIMWFQTSYSIS